jgi:cell division septum initiation protein DivIVA
MVMDTNDKLRKRVAELESDVASIGGALQYAERKIRQMEVDENRDDCRMALNKARRVVEHERKLAAAQDVWDRIGEIRTECARYGPALQEASECLRIRAKRVAELEAENERLRAALMPLETSSIASAVQEAAAATMQRDQLLAARAAVDAVLEELAVRAALHHWHADQWEGSHDEPEARGQWYGYSAAAGMLRDALSGGIAPASTRDDVLREMCGQHVRWTRVCPARYDAAWCPFGMTLPCDRHNPDLSDEAARGQNAPCWLAHYGLASEYADACELWAREQARAETGDAR